MDAFNDNQSAIGNQQSIQNDEQRYPTFNQQRYSTDCMFNKLVLDPRILHQQTDPSDYDTAEFTNMDQIQLLMKQCNQTKQMIQDKGGNMQSILELENRILNAFINKDSSYIHVLNKQMMDIQSQLIDQDQNKSRNDRTFNNHSVNSFMEQQSRTDNKSIRDRVINIKRHIQANDPNLKGKLSIFRDSLNESMISEPIEKLLNDVQSQIDILIKGFQQKQQYIPQNDNILSENTKLKEKREKDQKEYFMLQCEMEQMKQTLKDNSIDRENDVLLMESKYREEIDFLLQTQKQEETDIISELRDENERMREEIDELQNDNEQMKDRLQEEMSEQIKEIEIYNDEKIELIKKMQQERYDEMKDNKEKQEQEMKYQINILKKEKEELIEQIKSNRHVKLMEQQHNVKIKELENENIRLSRRTSRNSIIHRGSDLKQSLQSISDQIRTASQEKQSFASRHGLNKRNESEVILDTSSQSLSSLSLTYCTNFKKQEHGVQCHISEMDVLDLRLCQICGNNGINQCYKKGNHQFNEDEQYECRVRTESEEINYKRQLGEQKYQKKRHVNKGINTKGSYLKQVYKDKRRNSRNIPQDKDLENAMSEVSNYESGNKLIDLADQYYRSIKSDNILINIDMNESNMYKSQSKDSQNCTSMISGITD